MPRTRRDRRRQRRGGALAAFFEGVLWASGALLLGAALWMAADAAWYQYRAGAELARELPPLAAEPDRSSTPALALRSPRPPAPQPVGTPLARLAIPRLDVDVVVAEGDSETVLRRAVGRVPGTARLGGTGNVMLAGHRDSYFRPLEGVRVGDRIEIDRPAGRDVYRVEWVAVVEPTRVELAEDPGYPALTLVTCYPFDYVGDAPYRYVVRARRTESPAERTATG